MEVRRTGRKKGEIGTRGEGERETGGENVQPSHIYIYEHIKYKNYDFM